MIARYRCPRLKDLPATADAVRDGKLSKAQAAAVADAAVVAPDAESALIGLAGRESPTPWSRARAAMGQTDGEKPRRVPTNVIVRVDHTALQRGHVEAGEVCDIAGTGPIPVPRVQDILADGDAFTAVVVTDQTGQVTTVAHVGRRPVTDPATLFDTLADRGHDVTGAHQRSALDWTNSTCTVEGCDLPRQEIDHRVDWARQHRTQLDELDGRCRHHHALKTRADCQLAPGTRPMFAPTGIDPP